jgi:hypothetical protein
MNELENAVVDPAQAAVPADPNNTPAATEPPPVADKTAEELAAEKAASDAKKTPEELAAENAANDAATAAAEKKQRETHDVRRMRRFMQDAAQARAESDAYKVIIAQMGGQQQTTDEPQREQFADDATYTKALIDHRTKQIRQDIINEQRNTQYQQKIQSFQGQVSAARKEIPDIDIVLDSTVKQSPEVNDAMLSSPYAAQIAYELAKDDEVEAFRISQLPPHLAAREIGKIEARIEARKTAPAVRPAASKAPPPIKPVGAQGGEEVNVDWSKKSGTEYMDHLRKKGLIPAI